MIDFTGKRALITGGSRGVGRAAAVLLARAGAEVGMTYHSREKDALETLDLIQAEGSRGWAVQANFENKNCINPMFSRVDDEFPGGFDFFIANAGVWPPHEVGVAEMEDAQWRRTIAVNLDAVFFATRAAAKRLREHGRIVYVGSTAGQRGEAYHVDYAATKGALHAMVKGLCIELADRDITVNAVAPGWIDTEMTADPLQTDQRAEIEAAIPLGRVASAEDVAGPIAFLCSDLARHVTGEILNVNGGSVLCG